jgi:hypothetical protein
MPGKDRDRFQEDGGAAQLQERADRDNEQGARGTLTDPTPNHAYTVAGSVAGEPPETDPTLDTAGNRSDAE